MTQILSLFFTGSLYWIPEETHTLNSSLISNLLVKPDTMIEAGSEIWPGTYSKLNGLLQFDDITQEFARVNGWTTPTQPEQIPTDLGGEGHLIRSTTSHMSLQE